MFKKLGEFRNDVTDGISSVAQRSVQSFQEFINAPYTAIELPQKEADYFDKVLSGVRENVIFNLWELKNAQFGIFSKKHQKLSFGRHAKKTFISKNKSKERPVQIFALKCKIYL